MTHLHIQATVDDYDAWKSDFESHHGQRAEHGGRSYQIFQATGDPNGIVVLIEFDDEESARGWNEYLHGEEEPADPEMSGAEISYLDLVEHDQQ